MIPKEVDEIHKVINSAIDGSILQEKPNLKRKIRICIKRNWRSDAKKVC